MADVKTITSFFSPDAKEGSSCKCPDQNGISQSSVLLTPESTPTKSTRSEFPTTDTFTALKPFQLDNQFKGMKTSPADDTKKGKCSKHSLVVIDSSEECRFEKLAEGSDVSDDPKPKHTKNSKINSTNDNDGNTKTTRSRGRGKGRTGKKTFSADTSKASSRTRAKSYPAAKTVKPRNKLVTDFFPVRRSARVPSTCLEKQKQQYLEDALLNKKEEGLKVVEFEGKGRGVVAAKKFSRNDFIVEYAGDLISLDEARSREKKYTKDDNIGCYMYYFNFQNKSYCVDATSESGRLGRLINHSRTAGNCHTKVVGIGSKPYLILVASRSILEGEELLYDYGDRSKASREAHPWLNY